MEWPLEQAKSRVVTRKGRNMRSVLGLLVVWLAERLDRSLYTVPDIDELTSLAATVRG